MPQRSRPGERPDRGEEYGGGTKWGRRENPNRRYPSALFRAGKLDPMSQIFISHSSADNAQALAIRQWLAEEGFASVFLDLDPERGIKPGERWEEALRDAAG